MNMYEVSVGVADLGHHCRADWSRKKCQWSRKAKDRHAVHDFVRVAGMIAGDDDAQIDRLAQFPRQRLKVGFDATHMGWIEFADVQNLQPRMANGGLYGPG